MTFTNFYIAGALAFFAGGAVLVGRWTREYVDQSERGEMSEDVVMLGTICNIALLFLCAIGWPFASFVCLGYWLESRRKDQSNG